MRTPVNGASAPVERKKRVPVSGRNVLTVSGKEAGFHYRIVNDEGDRVQQLIDAGYELVSADSVRVGDKRVNSAAPEGSNAQVSVGGGRKAFVMRIREDWYKEDQIAKQEHVNRLEQALKQPGSGNYGSVEIERS